MTIKRDPCAGKTSAGISFHLPLAHDLAVHLELFILVALYDQHNILTHHEVGVLMLIGIVAHADHTIGQVAEYTAAVFLLYIKEAAEAKNNTNDQYTYGGSGKLTVVGDSKQMITSLYNKTMANTKVDRAFYTTDGRNLVIDPAYLELLPVGTYTFKAVSQASAYEFTVKITAVTETVLQDLTLEKGCNAVIYLGNIEVSSVELNGAKLTGEQYKIENLMLTINADLLTKDVNEIVINGEHTVTATID